ncbi:MAG: MarR family transcriptional regulator [Deltaproteobacteria bacterium]|nr:MAG: MarR family transcriptional regulator [Deltaproteobacteria bacterium]
MSLPSLPTSDYRALAEFRHHLRRFLHFSEEAARAMGLEPQQHQLLLSLRGLPPDRAATVGVLAERLQIRPHSTVELIDRTEARGLVGRGPSGGDRRQVVVRLTRRGEAVLSRLSLAHRTELRAMGPALLGPLRALVGRRGRSSRGTVRRAMPRERSGGR